MTRTDGRVAVVVAGGGPPGVTASGLGDLGDDPLVIAADSGLEHVRSLGLAVARVVGDMDSVDAGVLAAAEAAGTVVDRYPPAKDATDLDLALDAAFAARPVRVVVVTGAGDRFDHALAVALTVAAPDGRDHPSRPGWVAPPVGRAGPRDAVRHARSAPQLLPVHGPVRGVTTSGLLYPLDDEDLDAGTSRGVSNEWAAPQASVRCARGASGGGAGNQRCGCGGRAALTPRPPTACRPEERGR